MILFINLILKKFVKMTQKEKLGHARILAMRVKSIADSIKRECDDYDERWAFSYCKELTELADEFLKLK
jgi:hypothetical protein